MSIGLILVVILIASMVGMFGYFTYLAGITLRDTEDAEPKMVVKKQNKVKTSTVAKKF